MNYLKISQTNRRLENTPKTKSPYQCVLCHIHY